MRPHPAGAGRCAALLALLLLPMLQGCAGSAPSRFYVLTPLAHGASSQAERLSAPQTVVALGPVEFPRYLDRPQIVTRKGPNQLELAEFDIWAESLQASFTGVLVDDLTRLLADLPIAVIRWETALASSEYQVPIWVERFDRGEDGQVVLEARWFVLEEREKSPKGRRMSTAAERWRYRDPQPTSGYDEMAAAMSRAVEKLARDIEVEIRAAAAR